MLKEENIRIEKSRLLKKYEIHTLICKPRLIGLILDKSTSTIGWLHQLGVETIDPESLCLSCHRAWHTVRGFGVLIVKALHINKTGRNGQGNEWPAFCDIRNKRY